MIRIFRISRTKCHLPIDICTAIFAYCPQSTLLALLLVCRSFHHEALRTLYADVRLAHPLDLITFADTLSRTPALAALPRALKLTLSPSQIPAHSDTFLQILSRALRTLPNLHTLNLFSPPHRTDRLRGRAGRALLGHAFRLRVFRNSAFDLAAVLPFLREQPQIRVWAQGASASCEVPPAPELFIQLTELECDAELLLEMRKMGPFALTALSVRIVDEVGELAVLEEIGAQATTLRTLSIQRTLVASSLGLGALIERIAANNMQVLQSLSIQDSYYGLGENAGTAASLDPTTLAALPALTTVRLCPAPSSVRTSLYWQALSHDGQRVVVEALMQSCPTLMCVAWEGTTYVRSEHNKKPGDLVVMAPSVATSVASWIQRLRSGIY